MNIFDSVDPTNKKLEYFIFEDTQKDESAVAQMYFYVLEKLYIKNPEYFLSLTESISVSREEGVFRTPQHLINGYFVEANLSNLMKFGILKRLLKLYDLEDELMIKFVEEKGQKRGQLRQNFWTQVLGQIEGTDLFNNISPSKDYWIQAGSGKTGIKYNLFVTRRRVGIELEIALFDKNKNIAIFNLLHSKKHEIDPFS